MHGGGISCSVTSNSFQSHSSVHGILRGKNAGVCGHSLLQGIFPTQGLDPVSCTADGFFTSWATTEALVYGRSRLRIWQIHLPGQQALLDSKRRSDRGPNSTFCSFKPAPLPVQCFFILVPTSLLAKISSTPWEKQISSLFPKHYLYLPQAPYTLEKHISFPLCLFTSSPVLRSSLDFNFSVFLSSSPVHWDSFPPEASCWRICLTHSDSFPCFIPPSQCMKICLISSDSL